MNAMENKTPQTFVDTDHSGISELITAVNRFGLTYVFVDRKMIKPETVDKLREYGFSVVTGQGDVSRIKISWSV